MQKVFYLKQMAAMQVKLKVEQAIQRVNEAKQALNGNDNVQRAKDAAKQVITNANDLNQAQKDALKQQVDAARNCCKCKHN